MDTSPSPVSPYETQKLVAEYLLFHYGDADETLGDLPGPREAVGFAHRLVQELLDPSILPPTARALDVGCAVGGSSFELTRSCTHVLGIDYSRAFIAAAQSLARDGSIPFQKPTEGTRNAPVTATLPPEINPSRTTFTHGDACNLPGDLGTFDVILAANLICRLPTPRAFLDRLPVLIVPGGQLLLTTPFTWTEDYTPRTNWLGATSETGPSFEALATHLAPHFTLAYQTPIPFLIREHARKFQYTVAHASRWIRHL